MTTTALTAIRQQMLIDIQDPERFYTNVAHLVNRYVTQSKNVTVVVNITSGSAG